MEAGMWVTVVLNRGGRDLIAYGRIKSIDDRFVVLTNAWGVLYYRERGSLALGINPQAAVRIRPAGTIALPTQYVAMSLADEAAWNVRLAQPEDLENR